MIWILIILSLTTIVLILGVVLMAIGGKFDKKFSSKLMALRVFLQAVAVIMLFVLYMLMQQSN